MTELFLQEVADCHGQRVVINLFQNFKLKRLFAVRVPFALKGGVAMAALAEKHEESVFRGAQIWRGADPDVGSGGKSQCENSSKGFNFFELPDGFFAVH